MPCFKATYVITIIIILFKTVAVSQTAIALSDSKHVIKLRKNLPIAYLTDKDSVKLSKFHQKKENEIIRYGTIFKTDKIVQFDTTSIVRAH